MIIGIDPGPTTCGVVVCETGGSSYPPRPVEAWAQASHAGTLDVVRRTAHPFVVCEWLTSYSTVVGATVLDTARFVGRIEEAVAQSEGRLVLITRPEVALELVGTHRAKDGHIHEAVRDLFRRAGLATGGGACACKGTAKAPGPLYGVTSHAWDAEAVTCAWWLREVVARKEAVV